MKRGAIGILLAVGALASGRGDITLTDVKNQKATVEITDASPTEISFLAQGRKGSIPMDQLTKESRIAAIEYAKGKGIYHSFPSVRNQVKIAYQRRNSPNSYYEKDVKINSSLVIEGVKKLESIPAAEATLVLITHDTEMKYAKHIEKMKIYSAETISIPPAASGERREIPFQTVTVSFDTARDSTNLGGDEYKYFLFGLRDPETKQLIDFQSNSPQVMSYVAKHPEAREKLLAASKGSPFVEDFPK